MATSTALNNKNNSPQKDVGIDSLGGISDKMTASALFKYNN